ncbi:cytochrome C2 [Pseudomonas fluorescens HK44]|uniref:Cytochrome C2 n=1 Tax=Pseudomonas fluorescens HK44 TaxID=1042209 RepID=A0A010ST09_PSEFL|nr:cytochrome C2 [Pseudomonas fluorescens HK44]
MKRYQTNARMSRVVVHGDVAHLAGVIAADRSGDIKAQTAEVLGRIDELLASVETDKSKLLSTQIWLANFEADFDGMNEIWDAWLPENCAPARATCQTTLPAQVLIEVIVTAAI